MMLAQIDNDNNDAYSYLTNKNLGVFVKWEYLSFSKIKTVTYLSRVVKTVTTLKKKKEKKKRKRKKCLKNLIIFVS